MGGDETRITIDGGVYRYGPCGLPTARNFSIGTKCFNSGMSAWTTRSRCSLTSPSTAPSPTAVGRPDSLWIAYSKPHRRGSNDVFLYSLGSKKVTQVSSGFYSDNNPVFDDNGKYLYFISTRYFYLRRQPLISRFIFSTDWRPLLSR